MIDIEIHNFQAIDHTQLSIDGFTALVGRSNIGKSSIVRALKAALSGSSSSDDVRHDIATCSRFHRKTKKCQCFASVKMTFGDGPSLLWEKGDAVNRYTVVKDGKEEVYDRVGKEVDLPDFVGEQFSPVKMGSKHNLLQVSDQFEPLFLLNLSGTVVADTLSDLGHLDAVNKALALASKDRRTALSTRKIRRSDLEESQAQLARYADLDHRAGRARKVREDHQALEKAAARVELAGRLLAETTGAAEEIIRLSGHLRQELPAMATLATAAARRSTVTTFDLGWSSRAVTVRGLTKALQPPLPEVAELRAVATRWATAGRLARELAVRTEVAGRLDGISAVRLPALESMSEKFDAWQRVEGWLDRLQALRVLFDKTQRVRATPDVVFESSQATTSITRMRQLDGFLDRLGRLQLQEATVAEQLGEAEREEADVLGEFSALGLCPTCSQPITPAHSGKAVHESRISVSD